MKIVFYSIRSYDTKTILAEMEKNAGADKHEYMYVLLFINPKRKKQTTSLVFTMSPYAKKPSPSPIMLKQYVFLSVMKPMIPYCVNCMPMVYDYSCFDVQGMIMLICMWQQN